MERPGFRVGDIGAATGFRREHAGSVRSCIELQRHDRTALTFRAWDQTTGANGGTADPSTNGGTTAFSTATETASIAVTAVNDVPSLGPTGDMNQGRSWRTHGQCRNVSRPGARPTGTITDAVAGRRGGQSLGNRALVTDAKTTACFHGTRARRQCHDLGDADATPPAANANAALGDGHGRLTGRRRHRQRRSGVPRPPHPKRPRSRSRPSMTCRASSRAATRPCWRTQGRRLCPAGRPASPAAQPTRVGQALTFLVTTDNDGLFSRLPAVNTTTGTLTYTPRPMPTAVGDGHGAPEGRRRHGQRRRGHQRPADVRDHGDGRQRRAQLHEGCQPDGQRGRGGAIRGELGHEHQPRPCRREWAGSDLPDFDEQRRAVLGSAGDQPGHRDAHLHAGCQRQRQRDRHGATQGRRGHGQWRHGHQWPADVHDRGDGGQRRAQLHQGARPDDHRRRRRTDRERVGDGHEPGPGGRGWPGADVPGHNQQRWVVQLASGGQRQHGRR